MPIGGIDPYNRPRPLLPGGGLSAPSLPTPPISVSPIAPAPGAQAPRPPASASQMPFPAPSMPSLGGPTPGAPPGLDNLPPRLQSAVQAGTLTLDQALQRYRDFLGQHPEAPGNQPGGLGHSLPGYTPPSMTPPGGPTLAGGGMPSGSMPPPSPIPPQYPGGDPWLGGGGQVPQYQPPGQWSPPPPPQAQGLEQFYDPYALYASALPLIQQGMDDRISDAMATAGFTGNRFGTSAQRTAAQEGVRASNEANNLLMSTLYGQANQDLDRALQASGLGLQAGQMQEEAARQRFQALFPMAAWEQGRQDQFAQQAHDDYFMQMQWPLQLLAQFAGSQSGGSGGTPVQTVTQPARPGAADWISALGPILGLFG